MKKIILDTNFLLIPAQFKVDIFSEIERVCDFKYSLNVLDKTVGELKGIVQKQKGKQKLAAALALKLLKAKKVKVIKTEKGKYVDDVLVEMAKKGDILVATQDRALKKRLKVPLILLRQKKYLVIVG